MTEQALRALASELVSMAERGRVVRAMGPARVTREAMATEMTDRENAARLKEIIDHIGWPTQTKVTVRGMNAAWWIAQHATQDVSFMRRCLALMKRAEGDVSPWCIAYLEDRICVFDGRAQIYGTQLRLDVLSGEMSPFPIVNASGLDRRRAAVGLGPFADYIAQQQRTRVGTMGGING